MSTRNVWYSRSRGIYFNIFNAWKNYKSRNLCVIYLSWFCLVTSPKSDALLGFKCRKMWPHWIWWQFRWLHWNIEKKMGFLQFHSSSESYLCFIWLIQVQMSKRICNEHLYCFFFSNFYAFASEKKCHNNQHSNKWNCARFLITIYWNNRK